MSLFELKEQYKQAIKDRKIPRYCTFEEYTDMYGDEEDINTSSTHGDYSPGNPWDAPGMCISDFI